jgi:hypothetical protein
MDPEALTRISERLTVVIPVATPESVRPVVEVNETGIPLWTGESIEVDAGEQVDLGVIDLTGKIRELKLRIVDPKGARVVPVRIQLNLNRQSYGWSLSQPYQMQFSTLVPGPVGGEVWAYGYQSTRFPPQTGEVTVVMQPISE